MPIVNPNRLLDDLNRLREFGRFGDGVIRPSLSQADIEARYWLRERMSEAGLDAKLDGIANVFGRSRKSGPALLIGSHSDTQPTGGWLDGALGVVYGIEIARAMAEDADTAHLAVDAVAWVDEEGTFLGCLGSRAYCGSLSPDSVGRLTNAEGQTLSGALEAAGLEGLEAVTRHEPDRYVGYLEAHIEQGPHLEEGGDAIGVVSSIVGIHGGVVRFVGEQNHAGTTPMARRRDAGVVLFEFAYRLRREFERLAGDRTVWTIGNAILTPGAPSIIPGKAEMLLQFRDPDRARLDTMEHKVVDLCQEMAGASGVEITFARSRQPVKPTTMDPALKQHIADAAERRVPGRWQHMPSAAGHDPMVLAETLPCAMLFIPSKGGISHDFAEDSADEDIVRGCQVLADAAASILLKSEPGATRKEAHR